MVPGTEAPLENRVQQQRIDGVVKRGFARGRLGFFHQRGVQEDRVRGVEHIERLPRERHRAGHNGNFGIARRRPDELLHFNSLTGPSMCCPARRTLSVDLDPRTQCDRAARPGSLQCVRRGPVPVRPFAKRFG